MGKLTGKGKSVIIVIVSGGIFCLFLWLFLPRTFVIEKSLVIGDTLPSVYEKIVRPRQWSYWAEWLRDSKKVASLAFGGEEGKGSGIEWSSSPEMPAGKMVITTHPCPDSIRFQIILPPLRTSSGIFYLKNYPRWTWITFHLALAADNNIPSRFTLFCQHKKIQKNIDHSLQFLKAWCEYEFSHRMSTGYERLPECDYLCITDECLAPEISERISLQFSKIFSLMHSCSLQQKGAPFCIYHKVSDTMIFSVCIPAEKKELTLPSGQKISWKHLSPVMAAVVTYQGHYSSMGNAHAFLQQWITKEKKNISGDPVEMYLVGPGQIADSTKWVTKIYYPVQ